MQKYLHRIKNVRNFASLLGRKSWGNEDCLMV